MTQQQREFLIKRINTTFEKQVEELEESVGEPPQLNYYIVGAFLQGTIKILPPEVIQSNLTAFIKTLSGSQEFIDTSTTYNRGKDSEEFYVLKMVQPQLIMELPPDYLAEKEKWDAREKEAKANIKLLEGKRDTLTLQIQLSSNALLDKLIGEVDDFGDLSLFSDKMSLVAGAIKPPAQLTDARNEK